MQLTSEALSGIYNKTLSRTYDGLGRSSGLAVEGDNYSVNYSYDSYGRFNSLTNGADNFSYSYLANSELLSSTTLPNSISSTKTYEAKRNLLSSIENKYNSDTVSKFDYANDAIGRRTSVAKSGTAFSAVDTIDYGYNSRSELLSAVAKNDAAYNYAYDFDNIGNRISSSESGSALGYTSNFLNQYIGITGRNGISYDLDGNMLTDGSGWTFTWDAENRLSSAIKGTQRLEFKYDYASRRIEKKVFNGETLSVHKKYLYDGWNLIAEYDALNATNARSYVWGLDLTQTLQGAGGVGGLLSVKDSSGTYYPCYDGNGNVTQYLDNNGLKVASYDYNPFGRVSSKAGTKADDFNFQFSTKYLDNETELSYYGYRYYSPDLGRWINRDPIGEFIKKNRFNLLYVFVKNKSINYSDKLGLQDVLPEPSNEGWSGGTGSFNRTSEEKPESISPYVLPLPSSAYYPQNSDPNSIENGLMDDQIPEQSKMIGIEYCGLKCRRCNGNEFRTQTSGRGGACIPNFAPCPPDSKQIGHWHTHGNEEGDAESVSILDRVAAQKLGPGILITPSKRIIHY